MALPSSGPLSLNDIQTEFGGTNPIGMNEYYAGGGLVPAGTSGTYGAVPSSGTISIQNFYGTSNYVPVYVEELFQTWVYTGAGGTATITNGINVSGNGGLVWVKNRNLNDPAEKHIWADTARGGGWTLSSNSTAAQSGPGLNDVTGFTSSGFTIGNNWAVNKNNATYVSWTFRKQPKFFDIVTWTGDGGAGVRTISHALGSTPGCVIGKSTSTSGAWYVQHRSISATQVLILNNSEPTSTDSVFNNQYADSTSIYLNKASGLNLAGITYIAYIFAHNAGGFGATGTDNVISCGSYTGNTTTRPTITLGYEPQWILVKASSGSNSNWVLVDNIRGLGQASASYVEAANAAYLLPNLTNTEANATNFIGVTATGFSPIAGSLANANGETYIYIAIRRGPMKTPTTGTSVFAPIAATPSAGSAATTNFPVDMSMMSDLTGASYVGVTNDRLRGYARSNTAGDYWNLFTTYTWSESTFNPGDPFVYGADDNTGLKWGNNAAGLSDVLWAFRRAPGFFDVVCYTGAGSTVERTHNLGVVPELIIVKSRSGTPTTWWVYGAGVGITPNKTWLRLNTNDGWAAGGANVWNPTSTTFRSIDDSTVKTDTLGQTFVAYLFATVAGVSKVGTYTGTGALQTVNCGFTGGSRFVLIKRTDSTGDWYVWDSARGISSGNDPYLFLNSTAAQVTGTNYVDTTSVGFQVTAAAPAGLNASGGTYIFLAIA